MLCLSSTSIVSRMGNLSRHQFRTLERKYNDYYCYCVYVCLTGLTLFEDDGMLRSVAVFGSVAALYRGCECYFCCRLSARCMFCLHTGSVVSFDWFFICQHTPWCMSLADHSLTLDLIIFQLMWTVALWSLFQMIVLLQCDRWQCIYRSYLK
jgi:hypothetical protein